jgi:hypothetical protein
LIEPFSDAPGTQDDIIVDMDDTDGAFPEKERHTVSFLLFGIRML